MNVALDASRYVLHINILIKNYVGAVIAYF